MLQSLFRFDFILRLLRLITVLSGCLSISAQAQIPFFGSVIPVGNTNRAGESYVTDVATDAQGNVYVLGSYIANLDFGSYRLSAPGSGGGPFVAKFDAAGKFLWVSTGTLFRGHQLALDAGGNIYITGVYTTKADFGPISLPDPMDQRNGDAFVAKLDAAGNWLWAAHGGGAGQDFGNNLAIDAAGVLTVVGVMGSTTATFGNTQIALPAAASPGGNTFVARIGADGNWLSAVALATASSSAYPDVALDASGSAYVCGSYSGAFLQLGNITLTNADPSTSETYVAKLTPAGSWQWATGAGGGSKNARGIAVDKTGTSYLTGNFFGNTATFGSATLTNRGNGNTSDVYVAALDASGAWRWAAQAGGPGIEVSGDLALDNAGQPVITGDFIGRTAQFGATVLANTSSIGNEDAFVAKLDAAGTWLWALSTAGSEDEIGQAIATAPDGAACIVGAYWGEPTFGSGSVTGNPVFPNVYLAKVYDHGPLAEVATLAPSSGAPGQVVALTGSGFVGVTAVAFNGTPAAAFTVQSASKIEATVPSGVKGGPVSVLTSAGMSFSASLFQPLALAATTPTAAAELGVWPNPVGAAATLQLQMPATVALTGPTRAELRNSLGQVVRQSQFSGRTTDFSINNLAPGIYQLALFPAGQPALLRRVAVGN